MNLLLVHPQIKFKYGGHVAHRPSPVSLGPWRPPLESQPRQSFFAELLLVSFSPRQTGEKCAAVHHHDIIPPPLLSQTVRFFTNMTIVDPFDSVVE